jgi:predicted nucleotidyltransferase
MQQTQEEGRLIYDKRLHPVSDEMRQRILAELKQIEEKYQVNILYACESGSRGWGFASADSDYDVRFIYVHRLDWYLTVLPGRDVIERPLDDELDISGWELRKALGLLKGANPTLMEWLDSPIVYSMTTPFYHRLREIAERHFSQLRARHHYISMAKKNYQGHLTGDKVRLKKYLYVLRPLLAVRWLDAGLGQPPMPFEQLLTIVNDQALLKDIERLLEIKRDSEESQYGCRLPIIHRFIETELQRQLSCKTVPPQESSHMADDLDRLLYQTVMMFAE